MPIDAALGLEGFDPRRLTSAQRLRLMEWFFATYCRHVKGPIAGQTIRFAPWQREHIIRPIFGTVDKRSRYRKYTSALIGLPRKNMKSLTIAGVGLYGLVIEAIWERGAEIYTLASKKDQAQKVFRPAKMMVERDPFLSSYLKVYSDVIYCPELESEFRVLPADALGEHGGNPFMYFADELHAWKSLDALEAMATGTVGRLQPLGLIITTAGVKRSGPLWDLLKQRPGRREYRWWAGAPENADATDSKVWRAANPAQWVKVGYLRDQFEDPKISMAAFEAYHLNRFPMAAGTNRVFSYAELRHTLKRPMVDPARPSVMTIDGADKSDHFAIGLTQRTAAGRIEHQAWILSEPPADKGYYDLSYVEELILEIHRTHNVDRTALDGNRLRMLMIRLQDTHGLEVEEFPQTNAMMCPACSMLLGAVREKRLDAGGNELLQEHLQNAVELRREPFGWRIGKASDDEKIDGAIELAMGVYLVEVEGERAPRVPVAVTG